MNFSLYIAKRYLFSKSNTNAINIITIIAGVGVVVSTIVLFVILSAFSGLRTFSYSLLDSSDPDIKITIKEGKYFEFSPEIKNILSNSKSVKKYANVVEERVFLQYGDKKSVAQIKGVDNHYNQIIDIDSILTVGNWLDKEFPNTVVIGEGIAYKLSLQILDFGEPLQIMVPKAGKGFLNPNNAFNSKKVQIFGAFGGTEEFRNKYVFADIFVAQNLLGLKQNQISAIELKLKNKENANAVRDELQQKMGKTFKVETQEQLNSIYYKVINTENFIGYLIGTLITIIALFNILGSIIMMIIDKKDNLNTLFKVGASVKDIKKIFVFQGFLLTILGMFIGLVISIALVLFQQYYKVFMITETLPYPVEFRWFNLFVVILTISVLGYLASKIASSRINKLFVD